ncbi:hypothetical protein MKW92_035222 [Papaver armeniacum]|nr:hypothetical protein MKW92_035222 [Papaver armeniacum]
MDPEASRNAGESLELAFQMSNILETGLDRHTLSVLVALCEKGLNPSHLLHLSRSSEGNHKLTLPQHLGLLLP